MVRTNKNKKKKKKNNRKKKKGKQTFGHKKKRVEKDKERSRVIIEYKSGAGRLRQDGKNKCKESCVCCWYVG